MGPCTTCGQLTEPEADFCPACAGYAAPATIYSYAPGRLSSSEDDLEQILVPLADARPASPDEWLAAPAGGWRQSAGSWQSPGSGSSLPPEPVDSWQPAGLDESPPPEPSPAEPGLRSRPHSAARPKKRPGLRREGRWLVTAATLIVLIIAAGTVLLELARAGPAHPPQAKSAASTGAPAPSPTAEASPPGPQISVAPSAASSPHEQVVLSFLASYFTAINDHDFAAYQQLFTTSLRADLPAPAFAAGYGTTTDSAIRLTSIGVIGSGELVAQVSFVSHQQPSASPTNSACTAWSVSLYLLQQDGSYLLQQPPTGYQASYSAC